MRYAITMDCVTKRVDIVTFKGIKYRRYPDAPGEADRRYYVPGIADRQRLGLGRLHEEIWKDAHGPIPDGHHIHHRDHDPLNNALDNLVCLTEDEHRQHHAENPGPPSQRMLDHLARVRPMTAQWHGSDAGLAWHSQHAKQAWESREHRAGACEHCGRAYETRTTFDNDRFCSNACKSAARRSSGADDEQRICAFCESSFTVNRYSKTRFCSRSCGRRSRNPE